MNRFAAWRPLKRFAAAIDRPGLWKLADPTAALLREVQAARSRLNRRVFVRSLDAIHLVTAKAEGFERIYSNDPHLLDAAKSFGLEGVNPISR